MLILQNQCKDSIGDEGFASNFCCFVLFCFWFFLWGGGMDKFADGIFSCKPCIMNHLDSSDIRR